MAKAKVVLETAKMILRQIDLGKDPSLNEDMNLEEFCTAIGQAMNSKLTVEEYMNYIKTTEN